MPVDGPDAAAVIVEFDRLFALTENTRLVAGGEEPVYLPADAGCSWHRIVFREDFVASALHEVAHWCVAGPVRRQQVDFGYWYSPDGRSIEQQRRFEAVEAKPQALEWIFTAACRMRFRPSVDNLGGEPTDPAPFMQAIAAAAQHWFQVGLPGRAQRFRTALATRWGEGVRPCREDFTLEALVNAL